MSENINFDLECIDIVKHFGDFTAVDNVSFSIEKGSFFSILGPSGCGKTTLLRMLAGFENPTSGEIKIKNKPMVGVAPNKRPVNMVFQHLALFPNMNVAENIGYGLRRQGVDKAEIKKKTDEVLARVNLANSGLKKISALSGGQKQRIAIARCLVLNPDLLLLDEPLGALDLKLREHMKVELKQLQEEFATTFVYITHDQSEALVMSNQVAVMNAGKFSQVGSPQSLYYTPQNAFVAGFVGESNRWIGHVIGNDGDDLVVKTDSGLEIKCCKKLNGNHNIGAKVEVFVRPEAIEIVNNAFSDVTGNLLNVRVCNVLFDGASSQILVNEQKSNGEMAVKLPQTAEFVNLKQGDMLQISFKPDQVKTFRVATEGGV